ncbi:MAG: rhodanese-like domain-containing protein [Rhodospirillales bacterium]
MALPEEITIGEARDLAADDAVFVDVREDWERGICAIADSLHIPMNSIPTRHGELPKTGPLVIYCHHGMRSLQVVFWLRANGFENAQSLAGGIDLWAAEVDPEMATY